MPGTLITVAELMTRLGSRDVTIVDCRFELANPDAGARAYADGHIPGAVYAHLDRDLSGPPVTDHGRHPLPTPDHAAAVFGRLGIGPGVNVVTYDAAGGGLAAARLWWLLRYLGHDAVQVLDGGWQAWCAAGGPAARGDEQARPRSFNPAPRTARRLLLDDIHPGLPLLDARDPVRYRGEQEPIDPRAGHIPGARNHFWQRNLGSDGRFLAPAALRQALAESLGTLPDATTVHYCGSGVSACHNVLAQVHAGLAEPRLYCGSWSEWCRDPARPAASGDSPGG
ncbi:MAG: sulfurtransferase [Gammaproteobacteria bacterium]